MDNHIRASIPLLITLIAACAARDPGDEDGAREEAPGGLGPSALSTGPIKGTSLPAQKLALTFDDGPGDRTSELSAYLKSRGIRATFFINGKNVPGRQNTLTALTSDGHLLANHTQNHPSLPSLTDAQIVSELDQTDVILAPLVPANRLLFRAPYFAWDSRVAGAIQASAMNKYVGPIDADIGSTLTATAAADWDCWNRNYTNARCGDLYLEEVAARGRGIVLMHDPYGSANGNTVDMVKYMVPKLEALGYTFARVDEVPAVAALLPPDPPPPSGGITIGLAESVDGYVSDVYRWRDASGRERSAAMVRNEAADPSGAFGGYLRRFTYVKANGAVVTATGGSGTNNTFPGWGYTVTHQTSEETNTISSRKQPGTRRIVFQGPHHALHEYRWTAQYLGGPVAITVHWLFATGRDNPLWSATFDSSASPPNAVYADNRSPSGQIGWDGDAGSVVAGVGWGDRYKFRTTSSPESFSSSWTYSAANKVPHVWMWSTQTDTEMGAVQTQDWQRRDAGYGWLYSNWGRTSSNKLITAGTPSSQTMPVSWNWTYQLNQFELPDNRNKRLAWGMNYGAIGQTSYPAYGDDRTLSGYPYQSHSVYMVMGAKTANTVTAQLTQVERTIAARLTATRGTVRTSGPGGVGRSDAVAFSPAGYDSVYGTWTIAANASSGVTMSLDTRSVSINRPMFRVTSYRLSVPATIKLGAATLTKDVDYFASLDTTTQTLWLTLNRAVTGVVTLTIN